MTEQIPSIEIRPFASLGKVNMGWLNANHHFSFGSYMDRNRMTWGNIRVWNDDEINAQTGFPPHGHDNMEIITYVREGAITHRDSMGNEGRTEAGDVQVMSAGTGVQHSEYNLESELCRLFQIWILPRERGVAPAWDQRQFPKADRSDGFTVLASGFAADHAQGALSINADAQVLGTKMATGESIEYQLDPASFVYLVPVSGTIEINGQCADARDGVAIKGGGTISITARQATELVMVDSR